MEMNRSWAKRMELEFRLCEIEAERLFPCS